MTRVLIGCFALCFFGLSVQAGSYTSIAAGNFSDPLIWDCLCTPGSGDDVSIGHAVTRTGTGSIGKVVVTTGGFLIVNGGVFNISGNTNIHLGAEFQNNTKVVFNGNYVLNGKHTGSALVQFNGGTSLGGSTGSFSNTKGIEFLNGNFKFVTGTIIDFSASNILLKNTSKIINKGEVTVRKVTGTGFNHWTQRDNSILTIKDNMHPGMKLYAETPSNLVVFNMLGTGLNQKIRAATAGYYNLRLIGTNTTSRKRLLTDTYIINDLEIMNCLLDVKSGLIFYDIIIEGDWNNISGVFRPRTSTVEFAGTSQFISSWSGIEEFANVKVTGTPTLACDISVTDSMHISNGVLAAGFDIYIEGAWNCQGNYFGTEGSVIFNSSTTSKVHGVTNFDNVVIDKSGPGVVELIGTANIYETLSMDNGTLTTNDNLIIASDETRTGRIGEMGAAVFDGDVIVERYMNFGSNDWHLIGSSVEDMTIGEWSGDFITTGFPGSDWPSSSFNSITYYDETEAGHKDIGVHGVSSSSEAIQVGEGRRAYIANGVNKLSVKGPATTGLVNFNLSYTDSGSPEDDGWNLISNPYASSIDWDGTGWTSGGVKDAIYVWVSEDEQYASYVAGVGTNGGTRYIPSSQAFWVQTEAASPSLSVSESAKADEDEVFRSNPALYFTLSMTSPNNKTDQVAVRFDRDATDDFDSDFDAYDLGSANNSVPSMGLITADLISASIYSYGELKEENMIPMKLHNGVQGDVVFQVYDFDAYSAATQLQIYDSEEEVYYELRDGVPVVIQLENADYNDRFFLIVHASNELEAVDRSAELEGQETLDLKVWENSDQLSISAMSSEIEDLEINIYNTLGQTVYNSQGNSITSDISTFDLTGLSGVLIIELRDKTTGETQVERIVK